MESCHLHFYRPGIWVKKRQTACCRTTSVVEQTLHSADSEEEVSLFILRGADKGSEPVGKCALVWSGFPVPVQIVVISDLKRSNIKSNQVK